MNDAELPILRRMHRSSSDDAITSHSHESLHKRRKSIKRDTRSAYTRHDFRSGISQIMKWKVTILVLASFLFGYYSQLLAFYIHVRHGYIGDLLTLSVEEPMGANAIATSNLMQHVIFVCNKTNWDFIGLVASPHTILFAHENVPIPIAYRQSLNIVRHEGVDSYLNLHNKTLSIMQYVQKFAVRHFFKQDDDAIIFWPYFYDCIFKCKDIAICYAGDMHVNIGSPLNSNSYTFATGGSYFIGSNLLGCLMKSSAYVELDGLDYGEDKTLGKMIHYNNCQVQYVNCKWFNNRGIYSSNVHFAMNKTSSNYLKSQVPLLREDEESTIR